MVKFRINLVTNLVKFVALCVMFIAFFSSCSGDKNRAKLDANDEILAFGDSLTFGYGANISYPQILSQISNHKVINAGVNGDTSADGLARIDANELWVSGRVGLVIICLGGNDFLRKIDPGQTKRNLSEIIDKVREISNKFRGKNANNKRKIQIVLVGVPSINFGAMLGILRDDKMFSQIAKEKDVLLFSGAWSEILSKNKYKSDQIHANDAGYALFAQKLAEFLRKNGIL